MHTVGQLVRKRREALGLTLAAVASSVGVTKGYLSMIENHRLDKPPSRRVLEDLERTLGIGAGQLTSLADWQVTPEPIRQQLQRLSRDADRGRELAAWLHASTRPRADPPPPDADPSDPAAPPPAEPPSGAAPDAHPGKRRRRAAVGRDLDALYRSGELSRRIDAVLGPASDSPTPPSTPPSMRTTADPGSADAAPTFLRVPLINQVAAGLPTEHTDLGYPDGTSDAYIDAPDVAVDAADSFATRITGRSMQPKYEEGDIVVVSASAKVADGDDCFVRLEPDHESTFKRVYFDESAGTIRLQPLNPDFPPRIVNREDVAGLYRAVWKFSRV